jgi:imidazolonepropionase-like amidohydrolase
MISRVQVLLIAGVLVVAPAFSQTLVIENVTLIDGTGAGPRTDATVVVEGGIISAVRDGGVSVPGDGRRIDGSGQFLIPGLMDVHVHVPGSVVRDQAGETTRPENRDAAIGALHSFLHSGITSIYDAGNNPDYIMGLRAEERSGSLTSPRIFASGSTISFPGSWGAGANAIVADNWPDAQLGLDGNFAREPDLQKITYENFGAGANAWVPSFSEELVTNIIRYAREKGVRTTIHISDEAHARIAIAAGVDTLAHPIAISRMSSGFMPIIVDSGVIVVSTLAAFDNIARIVDAPDFLDTPEFRAVYTDKQIEALKTVSAPRYAAMGWDRWFKTTLFHSMENVKRLHDAGVTIALGTDRTIGPLTHRELELYVEAGISPLDAIKIGTLNAAKFLAREDELGTIEPGKLADMVLLEANPLEDISNTQRIARVFKGGREIDRDALEIPGNRRQAQ